jgi:hypothetical protein
VTIAQAIDESAWGQSELATRDHNLFGIKGSGPAGTDAEPTQEYEHGKAVERTAGFRVYRDAAQSIADHGRLLATSGYYTRAMADRDSPDAFAAALTGVYATDPDYGAKLVGLMRRYDLYRYDAVAPGGSTATAGTGAQAAPAQPSPGPSSTSQPSTPRTVPATPSPGPASPGPASPAPTNAAPTSTAPTSSAPTSTARTSTAPTSTAPTSAQPRTRRRAAIPATAEPAARPAAAGPGDAAIPGIPGFAPESGPDAHESAARRATARQPGRPRPTAQRGAARSSGARSSAAPSSTAPSSPARSNTAPSSAPRSSAARSSTAPSGAAQPSAAQPSAAQPSAAQPSAAQPSAAQPSAAQPSAAEQSAAHQVTAQPPRPGPRSRPAHPAGAAVGPDSWMGVQDGVSLGAASPRVSVARPAATPGRIAAPRPASRGAASVSAASARPASRGAASVPAASARPAPRRPTGRRPAGRAAKYQVPIPVAVQNSFATTARLPLLRSEALYRDVAEQAGIRWQLLAASDWMQCKAQPRYSPVHGEKLGTVNPDGTSYRTKSEALEQCADDLLDLSWAVYQIDLTQAAQLSVRDLANVFAAFRWGGLLKLHRTSAMEFPYSVAGLTDQHTGMRWPNIADPHTPDKPGSRFRMPFGAVPILLILKYPATA